MPAACRFHQRGAGVGDRGQAGLGDQADIDALERGREQGGEIGSGRAARAFLRARQLDDRASASGCASGTTASTRFRKARVVFAFSATQCVSRAAVRMTDAGSTSRTSGASAAMPKSSVLGTRMSEPRGAFIGAAPGVDAGRAQQRAGADQRQADQRGRVVGVDRVEQRDAQRFALGAAGAVVGLLGAQVVLDLGVGQASGTAP